jgi:hypothetical protein
MKVKQKTPGIVFCENNRPVIFVYLSMLKILSYLNIALALTYFMAYLMNSYSFAILGVLLVIVYNGLVIRNVEKEIRFTAVHYALGAVCLLFAGFLTLWIVNIVRSSIAHNYFNDTWVYILIAMPFALGIIVQYVLVLCGHRN